MKSSREVAKVEPDLDYMGYKPGDWVEVTFRGKLQVYRDYGDHYRGYPDKPRDIVQLVTHNGGAITLNTKASLVGRISKPLAVNDTVLPDEPEPPYGTLLVAGRLTAVRDMAGWHTSYQGSPLEWEEVRSARSDWEVFRLGDAA